MILKRLKEYLDYKKITISAFEKSIGMSNASFGKSLKSGGAIGTDKLENILIVYNDISPVWLLTGEGNMLISEESKLESNRIETQSIATPDPGIVMRLMDKLDERERKIEELTEKLCAAEKELIRVEAKIEALSKPNENTPESEDCPPLLVDPFTSVSYGDYIEPSKLPVKQKSSKKSSGLKT